MQTGRQRSLQRKSDIHVIGHLLPFETPFSLTWLPHITRGRNWGYPTPFPGTQTISTCLHQGKRGVWGTIRNQPQGVCQGKKCRLSAGIWPAHNPLRRRLVNNKTRNTGLSLRASDVSPTSHLWESRAGEKDKWRERYTEGSNRGEGTPAMHQVPIAQTQLVLQRLFRQDLRDASRPQRTGCDNSNYYLQALGGRRAKSWDSAHTSGLGNDSAGKG